MKISFNTKLQAVALGVILISFGATAIATDKTPTLLKTQEFSVQLPSSWVAIPEAVIADVSKRAKKLNPKVKTQSYELGFQLGSDAGWFTYPYGLVQVNHSGRMSEKELRKVPKLKDSMDKFGHEFENAFDGVLSSLNLGESVYDSEKGIVWTQLGGVLAGVGEVKALSATLLTSFGGISVYCYSKDSEYERYRDVCKKIIESVEVESKYRYRQQ